MGRLDHEQQCELLYFDESGFSLNPLVQYGWSSIGQTRSIEPQAHRQRVNVLGALRHDGKLIWPTQQRPTVRDNVVAFFDQIAAQPHSLPRIVLLGNAAIHKGTVTDKNAVSGRNENCTCSTFYRTVRNSAASRFCGNTYFWRRFAAINGGADLLNEIHSLMSGIGSKFTINFV